MTILDFIAQIKDGQAFQVDLPVKVGDVDMHALSTLEFLYNELPGAATYADAERVLTEAIWWHVTLNTLFEPETTPKRKEGE